MTINAVVARIQPPLEEPGIVAVGKGARVNGLEISLPCQQLSSQPRPELVRLLDRLSVEFLVMLERVEVRFARLLAAGYGT